MIARCRRRMNFYGRQRFQRDDLLIFCLALVQKHQQKQRQVQRERGVSFVPLSPNFNNVCMD